MINRDHVLHVARLARLRLDDDEVERMSRELSGILDHVEAIASLELDEVPPTSHVVHLENVTRDDVPLPSLDHEEALASAPEQAAGSFRVPSPQA